MTSLEFNEHILKLEQKLKYFALSLTRNMDEAEDLLQETYLKAITYRRLFVRQTNFTAWVYTIMKNIFINNYRKAVRSKTAFDNTKNLYYINSSQDTSMAPVDSQYTVKEITQKIDALKDEYKLPFKMHVEGHKYKEIAKELNLPIGTVKSRIFFARKFLMESLKDFHYDAA
ncbi:MAG: RNA polymerase subunit sigma [Bacteroidia bacterium]|nr:MAG: RNA polymerase subunit sigma [Bacteroidia bacterium]